MSAETYESVEDLALHIRYYHQEAFASAEACDQWARGADWCPRCTAPAHIGGHLMSAQGKERGETRLSDQMNRAEIDGAIRRADGWLHPERGFGRTTGYEDHMAEDVLALAEQLKEVMTALEEVWKDRRGFAQEVKMRLEYAMPDYEGNPEKGLALPGTTNTSAPIGRASRESRWAFSPTDSFIAPPDDRTYPRQPPLSTEILRDKA